MSTSSAATGDSAPQPATASKGLALAVILAGTFMVVLDFFIVNVAIPSIQESLHASVAAIQLIVGGYGLANAAGLILGGRLGDLFGRRRAFAWGLALFTLTSAACGFAPNIEVLVAARILQGLAGALLQPQVLAMISTLYSGPDRARAFAWYGMVLGGAAVGGQLIGGALISADPGLAWRSCFLINLPVGALALFLVPRVLPAMFAQLPTERGQKLDLGGAALAMLALTALLLPLTEGRQQGWPRWSFVLLAAAAPLAWAFARLQRRLAAKGGAPLIDPALFHERGFVRGLVIAVTFYLTNASLYFVLAVYLQQGLGLGALHSGAVFAVLALGFFVTTLNAPRLEKWLGARSLAAGAWLLTAAHALQWGLVTYAGDAVVDQIAVLFLQGAGIGMIMTPLTSSALAGLAPRLVGVASGVLATAQQAGNALGVALIGLAFYSALDVHAGQAGYRGAAGAGLLYLAVLSFVVAMLTPLLRKQVSKR